MKGHDTTELPLSSRELEAVTGLSSSVRQDWIRRRVIPPRGKAADRYSPREAAEIFFLQSVREGNSVALTLSVQQAKKAAPSILWFLLENSVSVRFNGSVKEQKRFFESVHGPKSTFSQDCKDLIGVPKRWIAHTYSVWRGSGWEEFSDPSLFLNQSLDRKPVPSLVVIDHYSIAILMAERLKRPIYAISPKVKTQGNN
jgi:hypothetical protein